MKTMRTLMLILLIFTSLLAQGEKINIAVLRLDPIHITEEEAQILTKKLSSELVKIGKYTVLDRGEMEAILQEQGFQQTGCTSSECAVEVGQLLGVQKIIAGSVGKLGSIYYTEIRMIDVETSRIDQTVDHNQEGSIEKVLLNSLPYVASQLSDGATVSSMMTESVKAQDQTLFLDAEPQTDTAQTEITDSRPQSATGKEVELIAHHKNGHIFMDGQIIGKDEVEVQAEDREVELYEKKWFYTSKPQKVNLARVGDEFGVGGDPKETVIGASFLIVRNEMTSSPAFQVTLGGLRQSRISNALNFYIGGMDGTSAFGDVPDSSYFESDTARIVIGGSYEWRMELELAEIFKIGGGFDVGFGIHKTQEFSNKDIIDDFGVNYGVLPLRHDVKFLSFGGPQIKAAVGWKKIFFETKIHFAMGLEKSEYYFINGYTNDGGETWFDQFWDLVEEDDITTYNEKLVFKTNPHISLGILLTI